MESVLKGGGTSVCMLKNGVNIEDDYFKVTTH